jgi:uncharacterized 2Fe-2S/4Fe-4S cluster protein (DUF4445 family)
LKTGEPFAKLFRVAAGGSGFRKRLNENSMPRITFLPTSRTFDARTGEQLLTAAWRAGVGIKSVCGGRGKCGSCRIEVASDDTSPLALNPATEAERQWLATESLGQYRLACQCEVRGDIAISVPPESLMVKTAPRKPYTLTDTRTVPVVTRVPFEVEDAYSARPRSLATRLSQAVAKALERRSVELPPEVIADYSLRPGFDDAREVTATLHRGRRVIQLVPGKLDRLCGLAIDIGTTSIVVFLCDLASGEMLATGTAANPQGIYGEDVISRMTHIQRDIAALGEMRRLLAGELNRLIAQACTESGVKIDDIVDAVVVGNPTMQHIFLGMNPVPLGRGPYLPIWSEGTEQEAGSLGLDIAPRARVFVFPMMAAYIGGDTIAAVLTRGADFYRGTHLLIDIGTNGEVVLAHDSRLFATSCATGPVYEGAHIRCGTRATPGAIERVWIDPNDSIRCAVISASRARRAPRPLGLCGSGVISSIAALLGTGLIGSDGTMIHDRLRVGSEGTKEVVLVPALRSQTGRDIVLTQQDVRAVQLGKSALRTGIEVLLAECGVSHIDHIYLAGTFGNHLEPADILKIGLVPPVPVDRIRSIGNAAGDGARLALLNRRHRQRAVALARRMVVFELSGRADFNDLFVQNTNLGTAPPAAAA